MNIAIIGTGNIGSALGISWAKAGRHIYLVDPQKVIGLMIGQSKKLCLGTLQPDNFYRNKSITEKSW